MTKDDSGFVLKIDEYAELIAAVKKHAGPEWADGLGKSFKPLPSGDGFLTISAYQEVMTSLSYKVCHEIIKAVSKPARDILFRNLPESFRLELTTLACTLPRLDPELRMLYDLPADATRN